MKKYIGIDIGGTAVKIGVVTIGTGVGDGISREEKLFIEPLRKKFFPWLCRNSAENYRLNPPF